jgi:ferredoxin, 2Fe-2S
MMVKIRFVEEKGGTYDVSAPEGASLMHAARDHMVPGIIGECGGFLSCGTCHVKIDTGWINKIPPPGDDELAMLDCLNGTSRESRLGCQVVLDSSLNGLLVLVPDAIEDR